MSKCGETRELMSAYIDNELDPVARKKFRKHLESCFSCRTELDELINAVNLCKSLPDEELPEDFKGKLHDALVACAASSVPKRVATIFRSRYARIGYSVAAALLVIVIAKGMWNASSIMPSRASTQSDAARYDAKAETKPAEAPETRVEEKPDANLKAQTPQAAAPSRDNSAEVGAAVAAGAEDQAAKYSYAGTTGSVKQRDDNSAARQKAVSAVPRGPEPDEPDVQYKKTESTANTGGQAEGLQAKSQAVPGAADKSSRSANNNYAIRYGGFGDGQFIKRSTSIVITSENPETAADRVKYYATVYGAQISQSVMASNPGEKGDGAGGQQIVNLGLQDNQYEQFVKSLKSDLPDSDVNVGTFIFTDITDNVNQLEQKLKDQDKSIIDAQKNQNEDPKTLEKLKSDRDTTYFQIEDMKQSVKMVEVKVSVVKRQQ